MSKWRQAISRPILEWKANRTSSVRFHHFWDFTSIRDLWFYRFIKHRRILEKTGLKRLDFYSVFGNRFFAGLYRTGKSKSIFFTGENLENYPSYKDHMLDEVDLSIGFEFLKHPRYFRFPLWLLYIVQPEWRLREIGNYIEGTFQRTPYHERPGFCCLVASHDRNGIRKRMLNKVSAFGPVTSAGKIYNNSNSLKGEFNNVKADFIKQYKSNICPENSNTPGYVTEKLFQSLESGCIPLYWGSDNLAEPGILNQETIWYFSEEPQQQTAFEEKLLALKQDPQVYRHWCELPKLLPGADLLISEYLDQLEERIVQLVDSNS